MNISNLEHFVEQENRMAGIFNQKTLIPLGVPTVVDNICLVGLPDRYA